MLLFVFCTTTHEQLKRILVTKSWYSKQQQQQHELQIIPLIYFDLTYFHLRHSLRKKLFSSMR